MPDTRRIENLIKQKLAELGVESPESRMAAKRGKEIEATSPEEMALIRALAGSNTSMVGKQISPPVSPLFASGSYGAMSYPRSIPPAEEMPEDLIMKMVAFLNTKGVDLRDKDLADKMLTGEGMSSLYGQYANAPDLTELRSSGMLPLSPGPSDGSIASEPGSNNVSNMKIKEIKAGLAGTPLKAKVPDTGAGDSDDVGKYLLEMSGITNAEKYNEELRPSFQGNMNSAQLQQINSFIEKYAPKRTPIDKTMDKLRADLPPTIGNDPRSKGAPEFQEPRGMSSPGRNPLPTSTTQTPSASDRLKSTQKEMSQLEMIKAISMGLGKIGEITTPSQVALGMRSKPYGAVGELMPTLEQKLGRLAEEEKQAKAEISDPMSDPNSPITMTYRELADMVGIPTREDTTAKQLSVVLGSDLLRPIIQQKIADRQLSRMTEEGRLEREHETKLTEKKLFHELLSQGREISSREKMGALGMLEDRKKEAARIAAQERMTKWDNSSREKIAKMHISADMNTNLLAALQKEEDLKRLSEAEVKEIANINMAIDAAQNVIQTQEANDVNVGKYQTAFAKLGQAVFGDVFADPARVALRAALIDLAAQYRKVISGANVSEYEIKLLENVQPKESDDGAVFMAKAEQYKNALLRMKEARLYTLSQAGRDVKNFRSNTARYVTKDTMILVSKKSPGYKELVRQLEDAGLRQGEEWKYVDW